MKRKEKTILKKEKEAKMKKGDIVQIWDDKKIICLGWGEVIGIGVDCNKEIPLINVGNKLIWKNDYFCIPEEKVFRIVKRIEKDLEDI